MVSISSCTVPQMSAFGWMQANGRFERQDPPFDIFYQTLNRVVLARCHTQDAADHRKEILYAVIHFVEHQLTGFRKLMLCRHIDADADDPNRIALCHVPSKGLQPPWATVSA